MQTIGSFLDRYKNFVTPPVAAARAVCGAIQQATGVRLQESQVRVQNGNAYLTAPGIIKSEIILNKKAILEASQSAIGGTIRDIR